LQTSSAWAGVASGPAHGLQASVAWPEGHRAPRAAGGPAWPPGQPWLGLELLAGLSSLPAQLPVLFSYQQVLCARLGAPFFFFSRNISKRRKHVFIIEYVIYGGII